MYKLFLINVVTSKLKITYVVCIIFVLDCTGLKIWQKRCTDDLKFVLEIKLTGFAENRCEIERSLGNKFGSWVSYFRLLCGYECDLMS